MDVTFRLSAAQCFHRYVETEIGAEDRPRVGTTAARKTQRPHCHSRLTPVTSTIHSKIALDG